VKRAIVLALSVILALTMAAPTVLARSVNGVAPVDVRGPVDRPPLSVPVTVRVWVRILTPLSAQSSVPTKLQWPQTP
jgi:hypothetical protein